MQELILRSARALESIRPAVATLEQGALSSAQLDDVVERGYFRAHEDEQIRGWFARFLTIREALWEVIAEVSEPVGGKLERIESSDHFRCFVLAYAAACLVVRLDRFLVERFATHKLVQRKLNEESVELRIPRKQFTAVFESLSNPRNALVMLKGMNFADEHRARLATFADDPHVGGLVRDLPTLEVPLDRSKNRYVKLVADFTGHAIRRLSASAKQQLGFSALESAGRAVAEIRLHQKKKRVSRTLLERIRKLLRPGDVLVTRHDGALSNLFLPGYWPHAALYIGTEQTREQLGVVLDDDKTRRWSGDRCVLEALKDGVRFRPLEETLNVDAVAVIRPRLEERHIADALGRVTQHEGKIYNFDFDFFRSDRLVCTEVVYRAFDRLGDMRLELQERAGRPTLSAEDLLDLSLDSEMFTPIAVYGAPACANELVTGESIREVLAKTYRG